MPKKSRAPRPAWTEIRVGQVWRERDSRFTRLVTVVDPPIRPDDTVAVKSDRNVTSYVKAAAFVKRFDLEAEAPSAS